MKKIKKKPILILLSGLLLVVITVAGTLAYLTSQTTTVTNTFSVGKVEFDKGLNGGLDEFKVNKDGFLIDVADALIKDNEGNPINSTKVNTAGNLVGIDDNTEIKGSSGSPITAESLTKVIANNYKLIPGKTYGKNPTAHIKVGSEPAWIYAEVVNSLTTLEAPVTIAKQMATIGWTNIQGNVWRHNKIVDANKEAKDVVVFNNFTIKTDADVSSKPVDITVKAYAIQSDSILATEADAAAIAHFGP